MRVLEARNEFYRVTNEILLAKEYEYFTKIFPEFAQVSFLTTIKYTVENGQRRRKFVSRRLFLIRLPWSLLFLRLLFFSIFFFFFFFFVTSWEA